MQCELVGHYGGDRHHASSAWTSTHRYMDHEREARLPAFLKMLADNGHETPFEKSMLHFLVRVDTVTHYQLLKHRIGVSVNTESARYKQLQSPTCHLPDDWPDGMQQLLQAHFNKSVELYELALDFLEPKIGRKRAKESARYFLPLANELTLDVSFNFRSFVHFLKLRDHHTAQREIAWLASTMLEQVRDTGDFEHSLAAFDL